ncbi:phosphatase PAP2 family protein [Hutsoniella sourekii]|uniref:phosphatase PAP2 family protein n=1 Tax=Hutsoniella sourekii TaxID=87650 RepID=UPI0004B9F51E|nr:phosphatase PAP2 family protein [Hutsoniella sourekii]
MFKRILLVALAFVLLLALVLTAKPYIPALDAQVTQFLVDHRQDWTTDLLLIITQLAGPIMTTLLVIVLGGLVYYYTFNWRMSALSLLLLAIGSLGVNPLVKNLVQRPRPNEALRLVTETTYSFPSGHSFNATLIFGLLAYLLQALIFQDKKPAVNWLLAGLVALIGFSRIYLGAHFLTDVLAGFALGYLYLTLATQIFDHYLAKYGLDLEDQDQ